MTDSVLSAIDRATQHAVVAFFNTRGARQTGTFEELVEYVGERLELDDTDVETRLCQYCLAVLSVGPGEDVSEPDARYSECATILERTKERVLVCAARSSPDALVALARSVRTCCAVLDGIVGGASLGRTQ
jgi:hypothetical protein